MWPLPPQHGGLHLGEGVRSQEPPDHPPVGPADVRPSAVRPEPEESPGNGAANPDKTSSEGIRLPRRGRISGVSLLFYLRGGSFSGEKDGFLLIIFYVCT